MAAVHAGRPVQIGRFWAVSPGNVAFAWVRWYFPTDVVAIVLEWMPWA